jgi:hypothetical protein
MSSGRNKKKERIFILGVFDGTTHKAIKKMIGSRFEVASSLSQKLDYVLLGKGGQDNKTWTKYKFQEELKNKTITYKQLMKLLKPIAKKKKSSVGKRGKKFARESSEIAKGKKLSRGVSVEDLRVRSPTKKNTSLGKFVEPDPDFPQRIVTQVLPSPPRRDSLKRMDATLRDATFQTARGTLKDFTPSPSKKVSAFEIMFRPRFWKWDEYYQQTIPVVPNAIIRQKLYYNLVEEFVDATIYVLGDDTELYADGIVTLNVISSNFTAANKKKLVNLQNQRSDFENESGEYVMLASSL